MHRPSLRNAWLPPFCFNTVLIQAITFVVRPTAIYRAIELEIPAIWLGLLGASFAVVPLLLAVPMGRAVDQFGERWAMLVGSCLTASATLVLVVFADGVYGLVVGTVLLGTGHLGSVVGQQAFVANRSPRERYDAAFGYYTFAVSAGQAIGPGLIVLFGGSQSIPNTSSVFGLAAVLSGALLVSAVAMPRLGGRRAPQEQSAGSIWQLMRRQGLLRALVVSGVLFAAIDISLIYLPVLGTERGISAGTVGLLLTVRAVASMASRLFLGRLTSRWGRDRVLFASVSVSAVAMAGVPVPMHALLLGACIALMGLGLGAGQPLTMSWLAASTPSGLRGRAMSLRLTGNRLGQVLLPSAAGVVALGAGAAGVLWATAATLAGVGLVSRLASPSDDST